MALEELAIYLRALHSQAEGWEGKNILAWVMDEASAFRTKTGKDNAGPVYKSLRSSCQSRFAWMHWMGFVISFPREQEGDFTLSKVREGQEQAKAYTEGLRADPPEIYGSRAATWEVNPRFEKFAIRRDDPEFQELKAHYRIVEEESDATWVTLAHPHWRKSSTEMVLIEDLNVEVPKEFKTDFDADGADALTRLMAKPPPTANGWFENPHTIVEAVNKHLPVIVAESGIREQLLEEVGKIRRYVTRTIQSLPPRVDGRPYYMHGDPGLVKDAFTICVCHTLDETKTLTEKGGKTIELPRIVVDFVLSWDPRPNTPVDFLNVDDVIKDVIDFYGIKVFTSDRWNSVHTIQSLIADKGIDADDMSFSNEQQLEMYRYLRLAFYNDMIWLPPGDERTQNELMYLKFDGHKITHDIFGKDRADSLASAVWNASGRRYSRGSRQGSDVIRSIQRSNIFDQTLVVGRTIAQLEYNA
ncbi:MAG: hypothetical protein AB7N24_14570 [Dehalococcoidia bacterium]